MALSYRDIKNNAHQFTIDYKGAVKENVGSPYLFTQNRLPKTNFLAALEVSSEHQNYIPMLLMSN